MRLRRGVAVVGIAAALTVGLASPAAFAQPPAPAPFELGELVGPYPSDLPARGTYIGILDGFTALRDGRPDVLARNLDHVVEVNNAADAQTQARALFDDNHDRLESLTTRSVNASAASSATRSRAAGCRRSRRCWTATSAARASSPTRRSSRSSSGATRVRSRSRPSGSRAITVTA
ncbi:hypothetical protein [Rhodococcus rhodnii]|uniref:Uncharacterized protein n=1 Tax=Rhodococcus rhodnii LMG 5362 TaxID=1273125 RepID=R7WPT3_9NOCA|nr:hypothetical protein [Rhodococcus rhodnii]EOM77317.1 hypothetical protein Rrhod_1270 [Rhodococcus rhodnii LMG 5362]